MDNQHSSVKKNDSEVDLFSLTSHINTLTSVSQLLSIRKGNNKSYLNEKTDEEIQKENKIIDSIDNEYFQESFNTGYILDQIPPDSNIDKIDELSVKIYGYHEVVDSRFNDLIMKSYNGFVEGMSQVYEIEKDLTHSAIMCKSGKQYLDQVQNGLTAFGCVLLQKHRKREIYKYILKELERIRDINNAGRKIDRLLELHDFPDAILLCQESNQKIKSSSHYTCLSNITNGFESSSQLILDKIDSAFLEICHIFNGKVFENVIIGYLLLDQKQRFREKIHQNFILNIEDHTKKILRTHLLVSHSNPEELKSMKFVDMCKLLKEEHYVAALLGVLEHLSDLMWSHYQMRKWILDILASKEGDEKEFYTDTFKLLYNNKRTMWNTIQNQIKHILGSCSPSFKIEEFLKVLESINQFIQIGQEFEGKDGGMGSMSGAGASTPSGSVGGLLKTAMKDQSLAYFEHFHKKRIEDLKTMLENEMWHKVPLPNDFTVLNIQEFGGVMQSSTPFTRSNSSSMGSSLSLPTVSSSNSLSPFLTLNLEQKPISLQQADHDVPFFNNFKQEGNPFAKEMRRKTLNEVAGDRFENGNGISATNGQAQQQNQNNTSSPLISSTTINVIRLIGKYLQMMKILKQLAYPIFTAIAQLLEYYVYSVYTFFGECHGSNSLLLNDDSISNISPMLKKTMSRLKVKFNHSTTPPPSTTSSLLSSTHLFQSKLTSSPISLRSSVDTTKSPQISHLSLQNEDAISIQWVLPKVSEHIDLSNSKDLYGLEYRVIGLESMMFIVEAIMEAQPLVISLVPSEKIEAISLFYSETVSIVSALRTLCFKNIASQILNIEQIYTMIASVKWEPKDTPTESSPYVKQIFIDFHRFAGHLDEIDKKSGSITSKVKNLLWQNTITFAMEALIEAYSRIKKCNNHGRTLMTMDLKSLQSLLEQLTTIQPIPHLQSVDKYIKAYFLPETDIYNLARDDEYTIKQVMGIVNVVNHLKKPQKQKLISDLEELDKHRKLEMKGDK